MSDEPGRMQVLDLYCLARFENEVQVEEIQLKAKEYWYLAYPYILRNMAVHMAVHEAIVRGVGTQESS